jgi:branched-chain amino acid aminotransferase
MSECYGGIFVKNEELLRSEEFKEEDISSGTSLYEVIRIIDGVPLFLERHLERLENSARLAGLKLWMDIESIKKKFNELLEINKSRVGNVKIVFNYSGEHKTAHNFYAYFLSYNYPNEMEYKEGVPTILCAMERENPNAKIINTSLRDKTNKLIKETGAYEAILVDRENNITEGSRSNIFLVKGDTVYTAPSQVVLTGITRNIIVEICKENNIKIIEEQVSCKEISNLDALFISGTSPKVLPIKSVDENIYHSASNSIVKNIMVAYNKNIENYIKINKLP